MWLIFDWDMTVDELRREAVTSDLPDLLFEAQLQQAGDIAWSLEDGKALGQDPGLYLVANVPVEPWVDPVLNRSRRAVLTGDAR